MIVVSNASTSNETENQETSGTNLLHGAPIKQSLRGPRSLFQTEAFEVPLFLELQFLDTTIVGQLEVHNEESEPVRQLCSCVEEQVGSLLEGSFLQLSFPD
jgi:hypothetical protein